MLKGEWKGDKMTIKGELMPGASDLEDEKYEEEWKIVMNTKGEYMLSKVQARILQQAIATGNRGIIMFKTFSIPIPYIAEFYRTKRYLKDAKQLTARASELPYKPMPKEKWEKFMKEVYRKIGKVK